MGENAPDVLQRVQSAPERLKTLGRAVAEVIVNQEHVVRHLLVSILAEGHVLLIGVPGLAKTLLVKTLAACVGWQFRRIQFTPDLMPSDVLGTEVLSVDPETGKRSFRFVPGPIFTNLLLADEINRTPPKTQAALLEAMQERQVTAGGTTYPLRSPFVVIATENPIEQEGTYPLPEAQLDRFLLGLKLDYPTEEHEEEIASQGSAVPPDPPSEPIDVTDLVGIARHVPAPPHVVRTAVRLVRATRPENPASPREVREHVRWGAGPRAAQHLLSAAKALAVCDGRFAPTVQDVRGVLAVVLRHRLVLTFNAISEGITTDEILQAVDHSIKEE